MLEYFCTCLHVSLCICVGCLLHSWRFVSGLPIPRCALPPQDAVAYYINPKNRGYLADPLDVAKARLETAQKFGYRYDCNSKHRTTLAFTCTFQRRLWNVPFLYPNRLPDLNAENDAEFRDVLLARKDPRQIFFGLWPGWVVNLKDKAIVKPRDQELNEYYASWSV